MIKFNKTVTALSVALAIGVMAVPTQAEAAPRSHYDYASNITNNQSQVNFVTKMIANYTRTAKIYGNLIDKYGAKYGHYSWFTPIIERHAFFLEEMTKYSQLLNSIQNDTVTVLNKTVRTEPYVQTRKSDPALISSVDTVEKEISDGMIYEYAVLTQVIETITTVRTYEMTITDISYSDGTKDNSRIAKLLDTTETPNRETTRDRELIRSYAVPVVVKVESPVEVEAVETGTTTVEILTVDEYLARDDVDYTGTEAYRQAAWNTNSRINANYIDRESGLAPYASSLVAIGAPQAWARGWTGKGSIIGIVDSGIDLDHSEFAGKIIDAKCFTRSCDLGYETVDDITKVSHGTHIAGIAAASLDGVGTTGVAYDADLLIAKTAYNSGSYDFTVVDEAIEWAVQNGADVLNMSGNYNFDNVYKKSIVSMGDGFYKSTDTRGRNGITYDKYGYAGLLDSQHYYKNIVEAMKGHEAVLVMSAGNQGTDVVGQPGWIALDAEVGDRVLIVGNYDTRLNKIDRSSNKAGTMCMAFNADGTCTSNAKISDSYLMAPGRYVASTDANGSYRTNSGTSQAAPMVTGAVAIVHQMWPHMTGANLTKLLLNTANKDIPNYDENVHGQGLLDLDEATLPQGAIGLPTTGRATGGKVDVTNSGIIAVQGGNISSLTSVMVIDDYDRDYYFDANSMVQVNDTRTTSPVLAAQNGFAPDYYIGFSGGTVIPTGNGSTFLSVNESNNNISLLQTYNKFSLGLVNESDTYLGNYANSTLMKVDGSNTAYIGYNDSIDFQGGFKVYGSATMGATKLDVDSSSMLKSADVMMSNSATVGVSQTTGASTFGFVTSMPVSITSGNANFDVAASVSDNGDIVTDNMTSSLASDAREYNMGAFYNTSLTQDIGFEMFAEARNNYTGTAGLFQMEAGVTLNGTF